jgi:KaiC/GvpD/RAD55 family RecA-like ATPase
MEKEILTTAMKARDNYALLSKLIAEGDLSGLAKTIFEEIGKYYSLDPHANEVAPPLLLEKLRTSRPEHAEKWENALGTLPDVSDINLLDHLTKVRLRSLALQLATALDTGRDGEVDSLMAEYSQTKELGILPTEEDEIKVFQGASVSDITQAFSVENVIPIYPKALGDIFGGGAVRGDHMLIFAPPECGKSAVAINMACGMAANGYGVLYVGNEDPAERMVMRILSRLSGMTQSQILVSPDEAEARAKARGYERITFVELAPGSTDDIKVLCEKYKPDVCVVDQLSNLILSGHKDSGKTEKLEKLAYEMRMFYKRNKIFGISLSQASEKAIGKLMLDIQDVFYSNIAVQGQVDIMIGIGMNSDYEAQRRRYLNVIKNKVNGEHRGISVTISPLLSKITAV